MATPIYYLSPISLIVQYLTNLGLMAAGGQVTIYQGGTVSTPLTTYTDSTGLVANPNPLTLSSTGRPVSASGAPVAFWHTSGVTATLVVTDALGNTLVNLPNIPAINDPGGSTGLQALLANPAFGDGSDLVANAVKAYDVVATVQANVSPTLAAGQRLIILTEGRVTIGDGNAGLYYWSASSSAADDGGVTTISPSGSPGTGRYLRYFPPPGSSGTFTATLTGCTGTPTVTVNYQLIGGPTGGHVTCTVIGASNVSNSTSFGLSNWLAAITPATQNVTSSQFAAEDNSANGVSASMTIPTAGAPTININNASGNWTNSGTKGFSSFSFSYVLK